MNEFWAKEIITARLKLKEGKLSEGISILKKLLDHSNLECVKESKKLLVKTLLQFDDKKEMAKSYLEELYQDDRSIQTAVELMTLASQIGNLNEVKKYYEDCHELLKSNKAYTRTLINYLYFSALVHSKAPFNEAFLLIETLIDDFKKSASLDHHFLLTRNLPPFYEFMKKIETLYLGHKKESELIDFLKDQLSWVGKPGKDIITEILATLKVD